MPRLLKAGKIASDAWQRLDDDAALPASGSAIVSAKRWRAERETLLQAAIPLGVELPPDADVAAFAADLPRFGVIALRFSAFTDGRAFSQARLLRERLGYKGELRAIGQVLREQFLYLQRCGFDALEIADGDDEAAWQRALAEIDVFYQPTADGRRTVLQLRHPAA